MSVHHRFHKDREYYHQLLIDQLIYNGQLSNYYNLKNLVNELYFKTVKSDSFGEELIQKGIYVI